MGKDDNYIVNPFHAANKYKHAWYWFRNVWNFENFVDFLNFYIDGESNGRVQSIKILILNCGIQDLDMKQSWRPIKENDEKL